MNISAKITDERVLDVRFDDHSLIVDLMDGRTISAPLAWYPRLRWEGAGGPALKMGHLRKMLMVLYERFHLQKCNYSATPHSLIQIRSAGIYLAKIH